MSRKGFTLIELLVVVAVLALLASIVFSSLGGAREGARISNALQFQSNMHSLLGSDLVGWWNFNDPDARYKDLSGNGNGGSCATSCPTPTDGVPGMLGSAMEFNGSDSGIVLSKGIDVFDGDFTVSAWVRFNDDSRAIILGTYNEGADQINFEKHTGNRLRIWWDGTPDVFTPNDAVRTDEWHLVSFSRRGNKFLFHVDGIQFHDYTGSIVDRNPAGTWRIGRDSRTGATVTNGSIDDVRVYSRALTSSEISILYALIGNDRTSELHKEGN